VPARREADTQLGRRKGGIIARALRSCRRGQTRLGWEGGGEPRCVRLGWRATSERIRQGKIIRKENKREEKKKKKKKNKVLSTFYHF
jgi:hypothetical protein